MGRRSKRNRHRRGSEATREGVLHQQPSAVPETAASADAMAESGVSRSPSAPHPPSSSQAPQFDPVDLLPLTVSKTGRGPVLAAPSTAAVRRRGRGAWRWLLRVLFVALVFGAAVLVIEELETSTLQAHYLAKLGKELTFRLEPGPAPAEALRFPSAGPFDERLGYVQLPAFLSALTAKGYPISAQARMSPRMTELVDWGLFPAYDEKNQAGLKILDHRGDPMYAVRYPGLLYPDFEALPELMVNSLLFIENRELLDPQSPTRNPAVEWDRLFKAVGELLLSKVVDDGTNVAGGSTLATQMEKYRHSPDGLTLSAKDKLRQMASASVRAYLDGEDTTTYRREIVLDYINTVPLAARAGYGEVNGVGDGLLVWYGATMADTDQRLQRLRSRPDAVSAEDALAYKQVLSLFLAQRRPSYYLSGDPARLNALADVYLDLLAKAGYISSALRDAAKQVTLRFRAGVEPPVTFVASKANNAVRSRLAQMLAVPRLYDLDRLDLTVQTTLDSTLQASVTQTLRSLKDPAAAKAAGLFGERLLKDGDDLGRIVYSFTLMERTPSGNLVRVQTDNFDQPFDINEGVKLDLGSTAKLRTLVSYLNVIAALHSKYAALTDKELAQLEISANNPLARWAVEYLQTGQDRSLTPMLEAAMLRRYSASPAEQFFTGGGLHSFENFNKDDNGKIMSVSEAMRNSVNLVFIRMMRDVVRYHMTAVPGSSGRLLEDSADERRPAYLARFADREGSQYMQRFYRKYQDKSPEEALDLLVASMRVTPERLAMVYNSVVPKASLEEFTAFLRAKLSVNNLAEKDFGRLYEKYTPDNFSLPDRGYIARVHPLELWTVAYLRQHPEAKMQEVLDASREQRQEVYSWLFKTRHKNAQDRRIRGLLEIEAFQEIHREWKRLGYPFDSLVASYATALGSSADRPASLAELMGIILNDGIRMPVIRVEGLHFAADTPYEAVVTRTPAEGERVLPAELTQVLRRALADVVEQGTARRLHKAFTLPDGTVVSAGGKTGTGDQRFEVYGKGGRLIQSRVVNRTATFVFYIGERFFGTLTAYVHGPAAADYRFTSGLTVQVLKSLAPVIAPLLAETVRSDAQTPDESGPDMPSSSSPEPLDGVPEDVVKPLPPQEEDDSALEMELDEAPPAVSTPIE